jgi:ubiquinone/menaquinone biosynthesis C-methylase UbiE
MAAHQPQAQHIQQARQAWDMIAASYDETVTPINVKLASRALSHIDLHAGMRFLDVAAGSGALGIAAARTGADVVATDLSPRMIEHLQMRARNEGITNLTGQVMDGHDLQIDDDAFDSTGSMFGVMLFPDLSRGLNEMTRVTRPGGKVLMISFGAPTAVEFISWFLAATRQVVPDFAGLPMNPPPLPFQCADPAKLRQQLLDAGARDVSVETTTEQLEIPSASHLVRWLTSSNPIGASLVGSLTDDQRDAVQQVLDAMLRERAGGSGPAMLSNAVNIAVGTV